MKRLTDWLTSKISPKKASSIPTQRPRNAGLHRTGAHKIPRRTTLRPALPKRQPEFVNLDTKTGDRLEGRIEQTGPGKNVLIRNKYVREDSGTHDSLKILDDSIIETDEEEGIDPYNTGQFDRSKNWDRRTK
jgi:hypothetical protein